MSSNQIPGFKWKKGILKCTKYISISIKIYFLDISISIYLSYIIFNIYCLIYFTVKSIKLWNRKLKISECVTSYVIRLPRGQMYYFNLLKVFQVLQVCLAIHLTIQLLNYSTNYPTIFLTIQLSIWLSNYLPNYPTIHLTF